jgi:hypothetical protein
MSASTSRTLPGPAREPALPVVRSFFEDGAATRLADLVNIRLHFPRRLLAEQTDHVDHEKAKRRSQQPAGDVVEVEPADLVGQRMRERRPDLHRVGSSHRLRKIGNQRCADTRRLLRPITATYITQVTPTDHSGRSPWVRGVTPYSGYSITQVTPPITPTDPRDL